MLEKRLTKFGSETIKWIEQHVCVMNSEPGDPVPFILNKGQRLLAATDAANLKKSVCVPVKVRQGGSSTFWLAFAASVCIRIPGFTAQIMAPKDVLNYAIAEKWEIILRSVIESMGRNFPGVTDDNKGLCRFGNGSRVLFKPCGETRSKARKTGIGETVQLLILSELAYWEHAKETLQATLPAAQKQAAVVVDTAPALEPSTAKVYRDLVKKALHGAPGYELVFWPWYMDEELRASFPADNLTQEELKLGLDSFQAQWRRQMMADDLTGDSFLQSYPETVMGALANTKARDYVVAREVVEKYLGRQDFEWPECITGQSLWQRLPEPKKRLWTTDQLCNHSHTCKFWCWVPPEPGRTYCAGTDPSQGLPHGDYQATSIFRDDGELVAQLKTRMPPVQAVGCLQRVLEWYNTAVVAVEMSKEGGADFVDWLLSDVPVDIARDKRAFGVCRPYVGRIIKRAVNATTSSGRISESIEFCNSHEIKNPELLAEITTLDPATGRCERKRVDHDDLFDSVGIGRALLRKESESAGRAAALASERARFSPRPPPKKYA